jgi:hypothetical protein
MVSFKSRLFYPHEKKSGFLLSEGWVRSKACLDAVEKRKISFSCPEPKHDSLVA